MARWVGKCMYLQTEEWGGAWLDGWVWRGMSGWGDEDDWSF